MVEKLDELDVHKIHRQNREVITGYMDFIEELAKKHKLGKYKEGVPPERKELLEKARQEYRAEKWTLSKTGALPCPAAEFDSGNGLQ